MALKTADKIWLTIGAIGLTYDAYALVRGRETLSEAIDRYEARSPKITKSVIHYLASHLANELEVWNDPLALLGALVGLRSKRAQANSATTGGNNRHLHVVPDLVAE